MHPVLYKRLADTGNVIKKQHAHPHLTIIAVRQLCTEAPEPMITCPARQDGADKNTGAKRKI